MQQGAVSIGQRVVLFDFDGVLVRGDTFAMFIRDRYARAWWRKALVVLACPWLFLVLPFSWRKVVRTLVHLALLGVGEVRYRMQVQAFADKLVQRPRQFRREAVRALRRHVAQGDRVVIVTGCEDTLVRAILGVLGIGEVEVVASCLRRGHLGMRVAWHNVGGRKVESLARHGIAAWQVAYSDSSRDIPMLALASDPVLVNASPKLCRRVEKALGHSVGRVEWY